MHGVGVKDRIGKKIGKVARLNSCKKLLQIY